LPSEVVIAVFAFWGVAAVMSPEAFAPFIVMGEVAEVVIEPTNTKNTKDANKANAFLFILFVKECFLGVECAPRLENSALLALMFEFKILSLKFITLSIPAFEIS
jgi:hypothetical protein